MLVATIKSESAGASRMALDVYVGPLTRYHTGQWENLAQEWARKHGVDYNIVGLGQSEADSEEAVDSDTARELILDWRRALANSLGMEFGKAFDWQESEEAAYFTDRPQWDGYASLLLWAAYEEHRELSPPTSSQTSWSEDPAWKRSTAREYETRYSQILLPELWLPWEFDSIFRTFDVTWHEVWIGSSGALLRQLEELNTRTFGAGVEQLARWRSEGLEPGDAFERGARFGFSVFHPLAVRSVQHKLPMKLDY